MPTYDEFVEEVLYFPDFLQGDDQDEVAEDGGLYRDTANWCLFGEIVEIELFTRLVLAFPMKLEELYRMNTALVKYIGGIDEQKDTRPCGACGKEDRKLKKCGGCGYYYYCDAVRVPEDGLKRKNHKNECKVLKDPNMNMLLNLKAATEPLRFTD
ncbi:hypothetical protein CSAL01_02685 [Colletotrichum salicis]|uniref:Suppressor of anucleate metulae protein B n=1 Tax=Colletotrichum salicis TaxID=1209931 RepID=A0A135SKB1_9PEZI|nr:hypothetical protein CSAL01_02685 [Colletotrichum salicis]